MDSCKLQHEILAKELNALGEIKSLKEAQHAAQCSLYRISYSTIFGEYLVLSRPLVTHPFWARNDEPTERQVS